MSNKLDPEIKACEACSSKNYFIQCNYGDNTYINELPASLKVVQEK